jgi:hypothetical protein
LEIDDAEILSFWSTAAWGTIMLGEKL